MNKFLVTLYFKELTDDFFKLIPEHRHLVNRLIIREVIDTYAVNTELTKGWITMNANDEVEVIKLLDTFPIRDYFGYDIDQLFIFNNALSQLPRQVYN